MVEFKRFLWWRDFSLFFSLFRKFIAGGMFFQSFYHANRKNFSSIFPFTAFFDTHPWIVCESNRYTNRIYYSNSRTIYSIQSNVFVIPIARIQTHLLFNGIIIKDERNCAPDVLSKCYTRKKKNERIKNINAKSVSNTLHLMVNIGNETHYSVHHSE